jgi:Fe-S cluster assembly protein SufD
MMLTHDINLFPSRRDEKWKYSDLRSSLRHLSDGIEDENKPNFLLPDGLTLEEVDCEFSSVKNISSTLAENYCNKAWKINVPESFKSDQSLIISNLNSGHSRIIININTGGCLSLVEYYESQSNSFINTNIIINIMDKGELDRVIFHDDTQETVRISSAIINSESNTKITQNAISFGSALSRIETILTASGENLNATINGAYLLSENRHCDMTSNIELLKPNCHIRQLVKGVVKDKSNGVFQGKFHVHRPAQHTDAEMRHDALMLSDRSKIRSKPELEIYADDVACAHGNTIGQLDEDVLFYLRQRSIPRAEAEAMLTEAFVSDVFYSLKDDQLQENILTKIRGRL